MRHVPLLALCLALVSIAQVGAAKDPGFYLADTVATQASDARIRAEVGELEQIYEDLAKVAGVDAILVWSNSPEINAFATHAGEERIVVVHEGLLERFGGDRDAVAAALGHELGHHKADHIREGMRKREGILVAPAMRAVFAPGSNRLHAHGAQAACIEYAQQRTADDGFADAGIGAGDEEGAGHRCSMTHAAKAENLRDKGRYTAQLPS